MTKNGATPSQMGVEWGRQILKELMVIEKEREDAVIATKEQPDGSIAKIFDSHKLKVNRQKREAFLKMLRDRIKECQ